MACAGYANCEGLFQDCMNENIKVSGTTAWPLLEALFNETLDAVLCLAINISMPMHIADRKFVLKNSIQ